jgi:hypothetical protein
MKKSAALILGLTGMLSVSTIEARFDPTQPPYYHDVEAQTVRKKDLLVSAIIISPNRKVAVVNDYVVHVGDTFLGFSVLEIDRHSVKFNSAEGIFSIPLYTEVKQKGSTKE